MNRGETIRDIIEMALSESGFGSRLHYFNLSEKDMEDFLALGERAINDIDEQFTSGEPV